MHARRTREPAIARGRTNAPGSRISRTVDPEGRYGTSGDHRRRGQSIYRTFGIDLARGNGDGTWRLPIPARFVIDRHGVIRAPDADPDYTRRPEPSQTVEMLRRLGS